mmetsp:Transcript_674/g.1869  ORF Transcript_674/g.1869 Transcript_674/m.1869 type:complete len:210 (+) Transcript_674:603-1232(+)
MGGGGCGYGAPTTKAGNGAIPDMPHESTFPPRDCGGARLYPSLAAFGKEGGSGITPLKNDGAGGSGGTVAAGRRASEARWETVSDAFGPAGSCWEGRESRSGGSSSQARSAIVCAPTGADLPALGVARLGAQLCGMARGTPSTASVPAGGMRFAFSSTHLIPSGPGLHASVAAVLKFGFASGKGGVCTCPAEDANRGAVDRSTASHSAS